MKYVLYSDGSRRLFDLARDPAESANLADHPDYAAIRDELHASLQALPAPWRVGDPQWQPA